MYFTLMCYDKDRNSWYPDFGDPDRAAVKQELEDRKGWCGPMRIIVSGSAQEDIDRAVKDWNKIADAPG